MAKQGKVVLRTGPFGAPERTIYLRKPRTVAEVVAGHGLAFRLPTIAVMDGEPVMRGEWAVRVVRPGDVLSFVAVPRGGGTDGNTTGKQVALLVGAIALSVAAPFVGGLVAGAFFTAGTSAFAIASAIGSAAFAIGGSLLLNALMPPATNSTAADTAAGSVYSVGAASNSAQPLQVIPVPYGRMRFPPRYATRPYSEYQGNDQYLYQLFLVSPGKFTVEKIEIDNTEAWNSTTGYSATFSDLTFQIVQPGQDVTLFPANVVTSSDVTGQTVPDPAAVLGPFVLNAPGTTINRIAVDFAFPSGLFTVDNKGVLSNSIPLRAQYQRIDNAGTPIGGWSDIFHETVTAATRTPQRLTRGVDVTAARYQVKFFADSPFNGPTDNAVNTCVWTGLRGYLTGFVTPPNATLLAMRIKANEQLSQYSANQINVTGIRCLPIWNGTSWSAPTATRSIAWAAADMLRDTSGYGLGLDDTVYDLAKLLSLDATWAGRGDTFNALFESKQNARDALVSILRAGRAQPVRLGGKLSFVRMEPRTIKRAVFTERNVARGSFSHKLVLFDDDKPDSVNASYLDETVWDTRTVLAQLAALGSEDPQDVDFFGITDHDQAWREGVTLAAINAYQREFVSFTADWEGKLLVRGDPVLIKHPFIQGVATSAVVQRSGDTLTVDRDLSATVGAGYVVLRDPAGHEWGPCHVTSLTGRAILLDAADRVVVEGTMGPLAAVISDDREEPTTLLLCDGTERPFNGLIVTATPSGVGKVDVLAVIDAPEVYAADGTETMPSPWAAPTLPAVLPTRPAVSGLTGSLRSGVGGLELDAMWLPSAGAIDYQADVSYDGALTWTPVYNNTMNRFTVPVLPQALMMRVAAVGSAGLGPYASKTFTSGDLPPGGGYITSGSFSPGAVDLAALSLIIKGLISYFQTAIPDVYEQLAKIAAAIDGQDVNNYDTTNRLEQSIASQFADASASAIQLFQTAASANSALAEIVTQVKADSGIALAQVGAETLARVDGDNALASSLSVEIVNRGSGDTALSASIQSEQTARIDGDNAEAVARTAAIAAIGSAVAAGDIVIDAETGIGGATTTIAIRAKASVGAAKALTGILLLASADGFGGTTSKIAFQTDKFYVVDALGNVNTALTFDTATGTLTAASINLGGGAVVIDSTGITVTG